MKLPVSSSLLLLVLVTSQSAQSTVLRGGSNSSDVENGNALPCFLLEPAVLDLEDANADSAWIDNLDLLEDGEAFSWDEDDEDPFAELARSMNIDLDDYNVTFLEDEGGEADHRRLVSVSSAEYNNARWIQYERSIRGIKGVGWSTDLIVQAQKWARYMASIGRIVHRPNLAMGISGGWSVISENIAMNVRVTRNGAHRAFMNSAGHRANILDTRVNRLGVGISRGKKNYYYVIHIFKNT